MFTERKINKKIIELAKKFEDHSKEWMHASSVSGLEQNVYYHYMGFSYAYENAARELWEILKND